MHDSRGVVGRRFARDRDAAGRELLVGDPAHPRGGHSAARGELRRRGIINTHSTRTCEQAGHVRDNRRRTHDCGRVDDGERPDADRRRRRLRRAPPAARFASPRRASVLPFDLSAYTFLYISIVREKTKVREES